MRGHLANIPSGRRAGFTLTESLIALTILAILATMMIPSSTSGGPYLLHSAARVLVSNLRLARELAIAHNTQWKVEFDSDAESYELLHAGTKTVPEVRRRLSGTGDDAETYEMSLNHRAALLDGSGTVEFESITLANSGTAVSDVTFGPLGGTGPARGEDTTIVLARGTANARQRVTITISWVTGQVWLQE